MWSGLSLGVTPALTAMLSPLWGRLADRFGRKIMVERSLVSFVVIMSAMAFVTRAVARVRAARRPGPVRGLRRAVADDGGGLGAEGSAWRRRSARCRRRSASGPALGPVIGGTVAAIVGLRRAFFVAAVFYFVALVLVFFALRRADRARRAARKRTDKRRAVTFRNVLAFENFLLMAAVIFGLQFVDRSFGPMLPLYVAQLGIAPAHIPLVSGVLFSIAAGDRRARPSLLRGDCCARRTARAVIAVGVRGRGGRRRWPTSLAPRRRAGCSLATPLFGFAIGIGTTAAYTAAGCGDPRHGARRRLRPADHRVAGRPRGQPDRQRPARRVVDPRGLGARRRLPRRPGDSRAPPRRRQRSRADAGRRTGAGELVEAIAAVTLRHQVTKSTDTKLNDLLSS